MQKPRFWLPRQKGDAAGDAEGGHPATAVDIFFEVDMSHEGVGEEGERRRSRADNADLAPRQGDEQAEETDGHECEANHEAGVGDDPANHANDAVGLANQSQVADFFHGARLQHVANRRCDQHGGDASPAGEVVHGSTPESAASTKAPTGPYTVSMRLWRCVPGVASGPLAAKPTPVTMRATPTQRPKETCSRRKNFASSTIRI